MENPSRMLFPAINLHGQFRNFRRVWRQRETSHRSETISSSGSSHPPRCTPRAVRRADACYASAAHLPRGRWLGTEFTSDYHYLGSTSWLFTTIKNHYLLDFSWLKCLLDFTSLDLRNFAHVVVLYRDLFTYFLTYPQCWSCQKHERWGGGVPFSICRCGSVSKPCTPGEHKNSW